MFWIPSLKIYNPETPSSKRIKIENVAYNPDKLTKDVVVQETVDKKKLEVNFK